MRRCWHIAIVAAALAGLGLVALDRLLPPDLSRYQTRSLELRDRSGTTLHVALASDGMWRLPATPDDVSPRYLALLLATEDRRFWHHPGVDPIALSRAAWQLATHGHIVSGGSTLTMQVARLLMPHRRNLTGKLVEIVRAVQLEAHYSKREILAMYLTLAPFGGNIEGVRAASLSYFEHEPAQLSDEEAALLVALPQSPTRLRPDRHPTRTAMAERRILTRAGFEDAAITAPIMRHPLPALAPHLADRVTGQKGPVATTLDAALQSAVATLATRERPWLGGRADLAALVIRNRDRAVLAYLGGADFLGPGGMVDMVRARRSPGSALKPFIYGLAFDDALIVPDTLIEDLPLRIGDYAPQNFDRDFHGTVSVREALQQSYNLPAVEMLNRIGPARFAAALGQGGAHLVLPRGAAPGLPMALGGLGISLEDLAKLYVALADGGVAGPLRLTNTEPVGSTTSLMTESAAQQIGDILRDTPRPDGLAPARPRDIAYKTGTSYGFRDAWAVGYSERYTVAIWVGRVEGSPRPGAFGRNTAAPLLFKIFDLLPEEGAWAPVAVRDEREQLAPLLRRYASQEVGPLATIPAAPRIVYPPPGTTLDSAEADGATVPIALEASGGRPPYRWAVNGVPLPKPAVGTIMSWSPDGAGFVRLSVSDSDNRTASEDIRVE